LRGPNALRFFKSRGDEERYRSTIAADIALTRNHHVREDRRGFVFGKSLAPRIAFTGEAGGEIVYCQIDVFREAVYGVEDLREGSPTLEQQPARQRIGRKEPA
jgi:hypothetical protein